MAFDLDDEELEATRKLNGVIKTTADDLLKELGFKEKEIDNHSITYKKKLNSKEFIYLDFSLLDKKVYAYYKNGLVYLTEGINYKLLIAIGEKMKELNFYDSSND